MHQSALPVKSLVWGGCGTTKHPSGTRQVPYQSVEIEGTCGLGSGAALCRALLSLLTPPATSYTPSQPPATGLEQPATVIITA